MNSVATEGRYLLSQARFRYGSQRSGTKLEGENARRIIARHFTLTSLRAGVLTVHCL